MRTISATAFRAQVSQIVDAASAGERIVVERNGKPIAALVPYSDKARLEVGDQQALERSGRLSGSTG
jgi:prevent-host-death family protein